MKQLGTIARRRNGRLVEDENDDEDDTQKQLHQSPQERRDCLFNSQNAITEVNSSKASSFEEINLKRSPPAFGPEG